MDALKLIRGAFISGMLVNGKDLMGLVFANTKHSPPPQELQCLENIVVPANCAVFLPMRQLTKAIVEHYLEFMASAEELFASEYGLAEPDGRGSFAYMIRLCIELLEKCGRKLNNAKIVYLTDVEEPHPSSSREFQAALQKASDLEGKEFEFQVVPMTDDFNYEPFYKEFITLSRGKQPKPGHRMCDICSPCWRAVVAKKVLRSRRANLANVSLATNRSCIGLRFCIC